MPINNKNKIKDRSRSPVIRDTQRSQSDGIQNLNFPTSNGFSVLTDNFDDEDMDATTSNPTKPRKTTQSKSNNNDQSTASKKKTKPITIKIGSKSIEQIKQILNSATLSDIYQIKRVKDGYIQVLTKNLHDKTVLIKYLGDLNADNQELPFYTYSEKEERSLLYVLKNYYFQNTNEVLATLKEEKVPATRVTFLNKSQTNPSYIVHFDKNSEYTVHKLNFTHKALNSIIVNWQKFNKKNKKLSQCRNCQEFGHVARNCGQQYRCVKCVDVHEPGKCTVIKGVSQPKCVNCGEAHPANNKHCQSYLSYMEKIATQKLPAKTPPAPRTFKSTPAPWFRNQAGGNYDNHFPPLNPQSQNQSSSIPNPHSLSQRLQNIRNDVPDNPLLVFQEFNNIPNIQKTLSLFKELTMKLKSTNCHNTRISIILEYVTLK